MKLMLRAAIALTSLLVPALSHAQTTTCSLTQVCNRFQVAWGGAGAEYMYAVDALSDGGFVMAGVSQSWDPLGDASLVRVSSCGEVRWARIYGGPWLDMFNAVLVTPDGGLVAIGEAGISATNTDAWVLKLDAEGNVEWSYVHGGEHQEFAKSIMPTADGGYIVAARTHSHGPGAPELHANMVFKLTGNGQLEWSRVFGSPDGNMDPGQVREVRNAAGQWDGYLVMGDSEAGIFGETDDIWLMRLAPDGTHLWSKLYGGQNDDDPQGYIQLPDGTFMFTGETRGFGNTGDGNDVWVLKTDVEGNMLWLKRYGKDKGDDPSAIAWTGSYVVIAGRTASWTHGGLDAFALKIDTEGALLGIDIYGGASDDFAFAVTPTWEGGFALAGRTWSYDSAGSDGWLIRAGADGKCGCDEKSVITTPKDHTPGMAEYTPVILEVGQGGLSNVTMNDVTAQSAQPGVCACNSTVEWNACMRAEDCEGRPSGDCDGGTGTWSCVANSCAWACDPPPPPDAGSPPDANTPPDASGNDDDAGDKDAGNGPVDSGPLIPDSGGGRDAGPGDAGDDRDARPPADGSEDNVIPDGHVPDAERPDTDRR
ncbi:MAG: hypothetical protein AB2A00_22005, partial [Myxococcota bacterium]